MHKFLRLPFSLNNNGNTNNNTTTNNNVNNRLGRLFPCLSPRASLNLSRLFIALLLFAVCIFLLPSGWSSEPSAEPRLLDDYNDPFRVYDRPALLSDPEVQSFLNALPSKDFESEAEKRQWTVRDGVAHALHLSQSLHNATRCLWPQNHSVLVIDNVNGALLDNHLLRQLRPRPDTAASGEEQAEDEAAAVGEALNLSRVTVLKQGQHVMRQLRFADETSRDAARRLHAKVQQYEAQLRALQQQQQQHDVGTRVSLAYTLIGKSLAQYLLFYHQYLFQDHGLAMAYVANVTQQLRTRCQQKLNRTHSSSEEATTATTRGHALLPPPKDVLAEKQVHFVEFHSKRASEPPPSSLFALPGSNANLIRRASHLLLQNYFPFLFLTLPEVHFHTVHGAGRTSGGALAAAAAVARAPVLEHIRSLPAFHALSYMEESASLANFPTYLRKARLQLPLDAYTRRHDELLNWTRAKAAELCPRRCVFYFYIHVDYLYEEVLQGALPRAFLPAVDNGLAETLSGLRNRFEDFVQAQVEEQELLDAEWKAPQAVAAAAAGTVLLELPNPFVRPRPHAPDAAAAAATSDAHAADDQLRWMAKAIRAWYAPFPHMDNHTGGDAPYQYHAHLQHEKYNMDTYLQQVLSPLVSTMRGFSEARVSGLGKHERLSEIKKCARRQWRVVLLSRVYNAYYTDDQQQHRDGVKDVYVIERENEV